MGPYAHIVGWGMHAPQNVVTNDDLTKIVDTSDEWIRTRTGIQQRHIATEKETTASMAIQAAREALDRARINPADVDLVIVATVSPEYVLPATASLVQDALGAKRAGAFDMNAGCTGFVYALSLASGMIRSEQAKIAVVIGAETMSRLVDWQDRSTCVLFGDGAGAVVLQASQDPGGVLETVLGSDGAGGEHLIVPAGGSKKPTSIHTVADRDHYIKMQGPEVFRFASRVMGRAAKEACDRAGVGLDEIDLFIPHQANARIIQSAAKYLKLDPDKVYKNLHRYGNTSGASIPIALCEALDEGRIKNNDTLVFVGFGSGLTWGAAVVKWGLPVPYQQRQKWYRGLRWVHYRWANLMSKLGWLLLKLEGKLANRTLPPLEEEAIPAPIQPPKPASPPIQPKTEPTEKPPSTSQAEAVELPKKNGVKSNGNGNGNGNGHNGHTVAAPIAPEKPVSQESVVEETPPEPEAESAEKTP